MLAIFAAWLLLSTAPVLGQEIFLSRIGDVWRYFSAGAEASTPASAWRVPGFNDQGWLSGRAAFGSGQVTLFPETSGYEAAYCRRSFTLTNTARVTWLTLRVDYSDGFIAYLNGREIARRNLGGAPGSFVAYDRPATNYHAANDVEEFNVTSSVSALMPGTNTLAVQLHSARAGSSGLLFSAELMANFNRAPHIQNLSSNQVQIIWKTPVPTDTALAYGPAPALNWAFWDTNLVTTHVATLTNLSPGSSYSYRASSSDGGPPVWGPVATFRTFTPAGRVGFIALGDGGWNSIPEYQWADVLRRSQPDFVLALGDNIYPSFTAQLADLRCFSVYYGSWRPTRVRMIRRSFG